MMARMGMLGSATLVDARTGRRLNNALTLTFKVSKEQTLGVATQAGGLGVLLGFQNGGSGRYALKGDAGTLALDCRPARTSVAGASGEAVGSIGPDGATVALRDNRGQVVGRLLGQPANKRHDAVWSYPVTDPTGARLGRIVLMRTTFDAYAEIEEVVLWWDRAGGPLKVQTLGVRLELDNPVDAPLGDLLLGACVDLALGPRAFTTP
jgi:hypothetical protein